MAITSAQMSGMIGGQVAMFGNAATYSHQISPYGQGGMPTYQNPMAGAGYSPSMMPASSDYNQAAHAMPGMMNAAASYGLPIMAGVGMMMGGPIGGLLDPFTGGARAFGSAVGWRSGAGITANLGKVWGGGIGGISRGLGAAALGAAPALALSSAIQYGAGQMIEGAQFQNHVGNFLQNNFRFTNAASRTGYGFGQTEQRQIGRMFQDMGYQDMMSTPHELLQIAQRGTQLGVFRGVQDAREFRRKFTEMKDTLKEIASTFNTTLSEAVPFFQQARQQGFWTPQDITRHAAQVRTVQANTGMSAAQAQAMTSIGVQMVRGIGGTGQQGAQMMAQAQSLTGAALFGGSITSRDLGEAGFGTGKQGAANLGQMLGGMSARFASSRVGRWALAAMMGKDGNLDAARLAQFTSGGMSVGQMGALARQNVSGQGAYTFVDNEENLRGQLAARGPEAALGMVRGLVGGRLFGGSARDQLITRRIIQRFMGGNKRQADIVAQLAREMPRMLAIQAARSENSLDAQERQREQVMNDTYESFKRRIGHWWEETVSGPLQKAGADLSHRASTTWQRWMDRMFGTSGRSIQMSDAAARALSTAATTGDMSALNSAFGSQRLQGQMAAGRFGPGARALTSGFANSAAMTNLGFAPTGFARREGLLGFLGISGATYSGEQINQAQNMVSARAGNLGAGEASAAGFSSTEAMRQAMEGTAAQSIQHFIMSGESIRARGALGEKPSASQRRAYAQYIVSKVKSGAAGKEAAQMLDGLDTETAITRVMAMQGSARNTFAGVMSAAGGLESRLSQMSAAKLERFKEGAVEDLTTALRGGASDSFFSSAGAKAAARAHGGIVGVATTNAGVTELMGTEEGSRAMRLYAEAQAAENEGKKDEANKLRNQAREALRTLAVNGDKSGLSKEGQSAAISLMGGGPDGQNAEKAAAQVGAALAAQDTKGWNDKYQMRMRRFREKLGYEGNKRLQAALSGGGEGAKRLRQTLSTLMSGGAKSPQDQVTLMRRLATEAARSPEEAARVSAILAQEGLAPTEIGKVLKGAQETASDIKNYAMSEDTDRDVTSGRSTLRGKALTRAVGGVGRTLSRMVRIGRGGLSASDLWSVVQGGAVGDAARKRLAALLESQGIKGEYQKKLLEDIKGGFTRDELLRHSTAAAAGRALTTYSDRVAKEAGLKPGTIRFTGQEGSTKFIGEQMKIQTELQRRMSESLLYLARDRGMKVKKGKKP